MKSKSIKCALITLFLSTTISISNPAMALFGVGDVVFDPSQAANMVAELQKWKMQYDQMNAQINQAKSMYNSMIGNRGYGNYMNIPNQLRNYLPSNFSGVMNLLTSTNPNYSALADTVRKYMDANAVLTNADLEKMKLTPSERQLLTDSRSNTAQIQAMADEALHNASVRFNLLQGLAYEINNATDPKAIAELQARIQVEQNMLTNEQTKLQDLADAMQAKKEANAQKTTEVAIQQTGNMSDLQQPDLSNIGYNYH
jgi:type IV secretion system protein VirB5